MSPGGESSREHSKSTDTSAMEAITGQSEKSARARSQKVVSLETGCSVRRAEETSNRNGDLDSHCLLERHRLPIGGIAKLTESWLLEFQRQWPFPAVQAGRSVASPTCAPHCQIAPAEPAGQRFAVTLWLWGAKEGRKAQSPDSGKMDSTSKFKQQIM